MLPSRLRIAKIVFSPQHLIGFLSHIIGVNVIAKDRVDIPERSPSILGNLLDKRFCFSVSFNVSPSSRNYRAEYFGYRKNQKTLQAS